MITLSQINIYPVKSLAGIPLEQTDLDLFGLQHDRRWMVVKPNGHFITQRTRARMALIQPVLGKSGLSLRHDALGQCDVPAATGDASRIPVRVWDDTVEAVMLGTEVDQWLSEAVGEPCHLVWFPDDVRRQCDQSYAREGDLTGFSDGFPVLLISQASLDDLNARLHQPVSMQRFRPNLVVTGAEPYAEDQWKQVRIGEALFEVVKPCSRCVVTTVDPETGERSGAEPLQTLSTYRKQGSKVLFGQNLVIRQRMPLQLGDPVVPIK